MVPSRARDDEFLGLDRASRAAMERFLERIVDDNFEGTADEVGAMAGAKQRVAIRGLAYLVDAGYSRALSTLLQVVRRVPAKQVPSEVGAAGVRALFASQARRDRAVSAQILGILGCREGIAALEDAKHLFGDDDFAKAAEGAIEKIRLTDPR